MSTAIAKLGKPPEPEPALSPDELKGDSPSFLHAVLCQVGLPRSQPAERSFVRTSGSASLRLEAGQWFDGRGWQEMPLPSGTRPRLVLFHICAEAIRSKSPVVEVEDSVRAFLRRLNVDTSGRTMASFKRQMLALASCRMQLGYQTATRVVNLKCDPIDEFEAWLQADDTGQKVMWPGVITLSEKFYQTLAEHAVPLDPNAIAELQQSALAIDTYTWLAHRLCRVRKGAGVPLSWSALRGQFGQEYRSDKDFKRELLAALGKALKVYPGAKVERIHGGLRLFPSPPPVKRKGVVVALPAATPKAAIIPAEIAAPLISEDALARVREVAPGWDKYALAMTYREWMADKPRPRNPDAAFLGWCKKFTKGKPPA